MVVLFSISEANKINLMNMMDRGKGRVDDTGIMEASRVVMDE